MVANSTSSRPRQGITVDGKREILGLWIGTGGEGAKNWLQVLTEIKNRGVHDAGIVVCDGLKGLPVSIEAPWTLAVIPCSPVGPVATDDLEPDVDIWIVRLREGFREFARWKGDGTGRQCQAAGVHQRFSYLIVEPSTDTSRREHMKKLIIATALAAVTSVGFSAAASAEGPAKATPNPLETPDLPGCHGNLNATFNHLSGVQDHGRDSKGPGYTFRDGQLFQEIRGEVWPNFCGPGAGTG